VAPTLHSLKIHLEKICLRKDFAYLLVKLLKRHINIRKLSLSGSWGCYGFLITPVALFPELESLSLKYFDPEVTDCAYSFIPRLKKLSELKLDLCQVRCVYVYLLETHHVCKCEHMYVWYV
jgi:hypothetical protein